VCVCVCARARTRVRVSDSSMLGRKPLSGEIIHFKPGDKTWP
jgi:hypothetical protein